MLGVFIMCFIKCAQYLKHLNTVLSPTPIKNLFTVETESATWYLEKLQLLTH